MEKFKKQFIKPACVKTGIIKIQAQLAQTFSKCKSAVFILEFDITCKKVLYLIVLIFVLYKCMFLFRNSKSKYYTSFDTYSKPSYPAFCNGGLTIISYSMLKELYSMAEKTNRNNFTLEDVYITGILRSKLRSSPSNIAELDYTPATIYDEFVLHLGQNPNSKLVLTLFWSYQLKKLLTETDTKFKVEF